LAAHMTTDQRTAVRAMLVALTGLPAYESRSLEVSLTHRGETDNAIVTAKLNTTDNVLRGEIAPFFAVLRIVFKEFKVEFSGARLTLRFSYEHRSSGR
jgi:hypothetical protein